MININNTSPVTNQKENINNFNSLYKDPNEMTDMLFKMIIEQVKHQSPFDEGDPVDIVGQMMSMQIFNSNLMMAKEVRENSAIMKNSAFANLMGKKIAIETNEIVIDNHNKEKYSIRFPVSGLSEKNKIKLQLTSINGENKFDKLIENKPDAFGYTTYEINLNKEKMKPGKYKIKATDEGDNDIPVQLMVDKIEVLSLTKDKEKATQALHFTVPLLGEIGLEDIISFK